MKIILILIITISMFSQVIIIDDKSFNAFEKSITMSDTVSYIPCDPIECSEYKLHLAILIREYRQYKTECYNDSTYSEWVEPDLKHNLLLRRIKGYTHRQPDFEGFMEYLERRIK